MSFRAIAAATTALALALAGGGGAWAQCPRLPAGLSCAPVPDEENARRALLQALDRDGRDAVSRGDYALAASAFGCLVEADPTPESAGNLAVVLREQGTLGDALLVARCAEQMAAPGPASERARARRLDIERRLGLSTDVAPDGPPPRDLTSHRRAIAPEAVSSSAGHRRWGYTALAVGASVLIGSAVLYTLGRQRAHQFADEQLANGYSERALQLREDTQTLEIGSWICAGVGAASAVAGGVLLRF